MARALFRDLLINQFGRPVASVTVEVFDEGTTTPVSTTLYADRTGAMELANPFVTSELGEVLFWIDAPAERVDVRYSKAGATTEVKTLDGVSPDDLGTGSGAVSSVFGRAGVVAADAGDYAAFYDPLGAAADAAAHADDAVADEAAARAAAVAAEATARGNADTLLTSAVTTEATNRATADTNHANAAPAHAGSAVSVSTSGLIIITHNNVQAALADLDANDVAHAASSTAHPQRTNYAPTGQPGAVAYTNYAGGTVSGPPASGNYVVGDWVRDQSGHDWLCVGAGTPGTWVDLTNKSLGYAGSTVNFGPFSSVTPLDVTGMTITFPAPVGGAYYVMVHAPAAVMTSVASAVLNNFIADASGTALGYQPQWWTAQNQYMPTGFFKRFAASSGSKTYKWQVTTTSAKNFVLSSNFFSTPGISEFFIRAFAE